MRGSAWDTSPWLGCAWVGSTARAELGVEGSSEAPLLALSQEAAQGWGLRVAGAKGGHCQTPWVLCSAHSPPHPTEELDLLCHPGECHPARTAPRSALSLTQHLPGVPQQVMGCSPPRGHLCPIPCPRTAAHRVTHRVLSQSLPW